VSEPLVWARELSISFGPTAVVDQVSLEIAPAEVVALVGESGSGKTLLAHAIAGLLPAGARLDGHLSFAGRDLRRSGAWDGLRGRQIGVVFQNPRAALNPVRRVGQQIADVIRQHRRLRGRALAQAVVTALAAVRIADPERRADAYPGELSGGMCQRVGLAVALAGDPSLLIADEPTTGLDGENCTAILALIGEQARRRSMATLLITHDLGLARAHAERTVVMHAGQIVEQAPTAVLFARPRHPYAARLIAATPARAHTLADLQGVPGVFPDLAGALPACRYADRCERSGSLCRERRPPLAGNPQAVACWSPL
jgi:oligopeptide/dipeptide ABC transporter ATP-binding protein